MKEKTNNVSNLPEINKRIKSLILEFSSGNVTEFARQISLLLHNRSSGKEIISQQSIDRLFKIDKRSNKYPSPSEKIIDSIIETYNISKKWLILGETPKFNQVNNEITEEEYITIKNKSHEEQIVILFKEIKSLQKQLENQSVLNDGNARKIIEVIGKERSAIMDVLQKGFKVEKKENH